MRRYRNHTGSLALALLTHLAAAVTVLALGFLVGYVLIRGVPNLNADMFSLTYTSDNQSMLPAILNTCTMTLLALLAAVLAALALAAGFAWRSTPVPVQNSAYAFACPRSVSVQTQGDRSTFWVEGTQVGGIDCYPALPWETLTQGLWTVPLPTGTLAASDPLFSAYLLECSALGQPVTLQEAGGRTHTLYFSPAGACYDLWLDPGSPAPADLSAIRASFTLL